MRKATLTRAERRTLIHLHVSNDMHGVREIATILTPPGKRKQSKYRNKKTVAEGIVFDSKREAQAWLKLRMLEQAGSITNLARQVMYPLVVNGVKVASYKADFTYLLNGQRIVADAKGVRTLDYVIKKKLMKALYGIEILEL